MVDTDTPLPVEKEDNVILECTIDSIVNDNRGETSDAIGTYAW